MKLQLFLYWLYTRVMCLQKETLELEVLSLCFICQYCYFIGILLIFMKLSQRWKFACCNVKNGQVSRTMAMSFFPKRIVCVTGDWLSHILNTNECENVFKFQILESLCDLYQLRILV